MVTHSRRLFATEVLEGADGKGGKSYSLIILGIILKCRCPPTEYELQLAGVLLEIKLNIEILRSYFPVAVPIYAFPAKRVVNWVYTEQVTVVLSTGIKTVNLRSSSLLFMKSMHVGINIDIYNLLQYENRLYLPHVYSAKNKNIIYVKCIQLYKINNNI